MTGVNAPLVVVADLGESGVGAADVDALARQIADVPGIVSVGPPLTSADGDTVVLTATPTTGPADPDTSATIDRVRDVVPGNVYVTGITALTDDLNAQLSDTLPLFVGAVIAVSFLLLMLVFRSIAVPLKAAVMNLLSIGGAYGVLVVVFQWGWGAELLGLEGPTPITSIIVVIMFPILFGLSMDYEVFLLSRIKEEYDRTGDNAESVARGLAGTGRVVTSAALIMIVVFLSFVASPVPSLKMLGLGLAVAILIDATVVRMVLVPAAMALLGDANWWLPSLARPGAAADHRRGAPPHDAPGQPAERAHDRSHRMITVHARHEEVRPPHRGRRRLVRRRARPGHRVPRPERGREVHDDADHGRPHAAHPRRGTDRRAALPRPGEPGPAASGCSSTRPPSTPVAPAARSSPSAPRPWDCPAPGSTRCSTGCPSSPVEARRRLRDYSLGMRQRLGIAHALLGDPSILVLDEPANGLDPAGIHWMRGLLGDYAAGGGTVLLSSHLLHEVERVADDLVLIGRGRIVAQGTKDELLQTRGAYVEAVRQPDLVRALDAAGICTTASGTRLRSDADPRQVGAVAAAHGIALDLLRPAEGAGLEDLFLQLTADTQREGAAA